MNRTAPWYWAMLISWFCAAPAAAQDISTLLKQAELLERSFHEDEALQKYSDVISRDSSNIKALCSASELCSIIGKRKDSKDQQRIWYKRGNDLARRALAVAPNHSEANFAMAMSLGRIAQVGSAQEKIKAAKDIKIYADRCIQLDPTNYKGYFLIARWNYEISDLNALEKWLVKVSFGALPPASLDAAISNYRKSMELNPSFVLNYYELAKAYQRNNESQAAKKLLQAMETLPPVYSDDVKIKTLGRKMLSEL